MIMDGSKITKPESFVCEQQNLGKPAWTYVMLQPFSLADALVCMFLFCSPSVFMYLIIFEVSTSSNLFEVAQQVQELLWGSDRQYDCINL